MKLIERYVFRKMAAALVFSFLALAVMVWLSQALREFDLVTQQGQSLATFLQLSAFLLPILIMIVLPLSVLIAVTYTFSALNGELELAVINASGAPQFALLKPALLVGLITTLLIGAMSLYFTPRSLELGQELITQVRSSIVSSIVREGQFISLADGLTFQVKSRKADGSLNGIFVSDDRDPNRTMTYLAEKGAVIDNPLGVFLVMANGTIQQRSKVDQSISIIEFSSYAFDLSTFASSASVPALRPNQRPTAYLLHPDPDDPFFRQSPGAFTAELHDRLTAPLYGVVFALVPLLFIGQAQSARMSSAPGITMASLTLVLIRAAGFFAVYPAAHSALAVVLMYALPLGTIAGTIALVLNGVQFRVSDRLLASIDALWTRIAGLWRRRSEPAAARA